MSCVYAKWTLTHSKVGSRHKDNKRQAIWIAKIRFLHTLCSEALQLSGYDDGNTKSNTLWWIASRPGMGGGPTPSPGPTSPAPPTTTPTNTTPGPRGCCGDLSFTDPR